MSQSAVELAEVILQKKANTQHGAVPQANNSATTLVVRLHEAKTANPPESVFSAKFKHVLWDVHFDPRGYDQCNLCIVVTTFLAFLYSRSLLAILIGFAAWFLYQSIVWFAIPMFSRTIKEHVAHVESRDNEPVVDWILFLLSAAVAWYIFEVSFIGHNLRRDTPDEFPETPRQWATLIIVVLVSLLSTFPDIYFLSCGLTLAAIFGTYFINPTDYQLTISLLAAVSVVYFYAWFKNPIAFHFTWNALFALFSALFIVGLLEGVRNT